MSVLLRDCLQMIPQANTKWASIQDDDLARCTQYPCLELIGLKLIKTELILVRSIELCFFSI